jgi:hypothetical protein
LRSGPLSRAGVVGQDDPVGGVEAPDDGPAGAAERERKRPIDPHLGVVVDRVDERLHLAGAPLDAGDAGGRGERALLAHDEPPLASMVMPLARFASPLTVVRAAPGTGKRVPSSAIRRMAAGGALVK